MGFITGMRYCSECEVEQSHRELLCWNCGQPTKFGTTDNGWKLGAGQFVNGESVNYVPTAA